MKLSKAEREQILKADRELMWEDVELNVYKSYTICSTRDKFDKDYQCIIKPKLFLTVGEFVSHSVTPAQSEAGMDASFFGFVTRGEALGAAKHHIDGLG